MTPSPKQRLIDLLAMGRVANLPTVVSNVVLGVYLGAVTAHSDPGITVILQVVLAGCSFYLGGCFLNDWKDAAWDAEHRPERAVPAGRIRREALGGLAAVLLITGVILAGFINVPCLLAAAGLTLSIVTYTWLHKRTTWSILPMGLCRALLYVLGGVSQVLPTYPSSPAASMALFGFIPVTGDIETIDLIAKALILGFTAVGLLAYVAGLSLMARFESRGTLHRSYLMIGLCLLFLPAFTHSVLLMPNLPIPTLLALLPFLIITTFGAWSIRGNIPRGVAIFLAGIALIDLIVAIPMAVGSRGDYIVPLIVSITAFLLALLLQKIAPAT